MATKRRTRLSRREFMKMSAAATAGITIIPGLSCTMDNIASPMKRRFGKTGFQVTTMGLGGQASIQWTPEGVDPVKIILKAFELGINYFDTSNVYGPSQLNYAKAFKELNLIPGAANYNKDLRESIFLTSKTMIRWGKGGFEQREKVINASNGDRTAGAIVDLKRTLSQIYGDDQGNYPEGSYLDMILIHNLNTLEEVDILYKGLESELDPNDNFGALVALRDYRDGTNFTGLNPKNEKLIKHIGFSGHRSAPVMMEMIRRDQYGLLDGMLVAINVNDRRYLNMQYNVIQLAQAKDIAVIGMKVFSDGAMYSKKTSWSRNPEDVVLTVGSPDIPSKSLIEYVLTTPGVDTLIIGIGHIDDDPLKCQLAQNFYAAQIAPNALSIEERREMENLGLKAKEGKSNYFQLDSTGLTPPEKIMLTKEDKVKLSWNTAYAGDEPLSHYEIIRDGAKIGEIKHAPQISTEPFTFLDETLGSEYCIATVDISGKKVLSEIIRT
jgi:aryl-alcohol dehydrogenase-like predicted oxidoreductase